MNFVLPQFGIFAQGTHAHHFLEFDLKPGVGSDQAVAAFRRLRTPDVSAGGINLVVAFGARAWREAAPEMAPAELTPFEPVLGGDGHTAPATQHDAWLWISGAEPDVTWQSARAAVQAVADAALVAAEQEGFTYLGVVTSRASSMARRTRRSVVPGRSRSCPRAIQGKAAVT